jgi:cytochrome c biogenesis protein CcdA
VIDVVGSAIERAIEPTAWAPIVGFGAGMASSFGPCVAPRFVALASLTAGDVGLRRWVRIGAFVVGLCTSYVLLGTVAGALGYLAAYSAYVYAALGLGLVAGGLSAVMREPRAACDQHAPRAPGAPLGAVFVAGLAFVAVGSPCCGPIAAVLASGGAAGGGGVARSAALLTAFALGHAAPLVAVACGSTRLGHRLHTRIPSSAFATVSGATMIALGSYYAVLA